jgi:hypothetical protein
MTIMFPTVLNYLLVAAGLFVCLLLTTPSLYITYFYDGTNIYLRTLENNVVVLS